MKYEESETVELKREINADFKKEIVAFANSEGGEIYVGVDKDGNPVGVVESEKTMEQIGNIIRDGIKPDLTAYTSIQLIEDGNAKIIQVSVLRGTKRPYHLTDKGLKPNGVFIRHGVSSVPATDEAIRLMLRESDGVTFDKSRCLDQELSFLYTRQYFQNSGVSFTDSNMRTLGLIDSDGYFTNAGLLLSDQCGHSIKCAVYEGTGKLKFKSRKEFFGSILKQMDEAYDYISMSNNLNSTLDKLKRVDTPDYPPYAIREALLNTIIHRDYDYSGNTIINIFDDRIEFISLGGLVKGITLIDIMGGVSQPRNFVIANIFYRLELIESYGTGIGRIMESYKESTKKPIFHPAPASFVVTLPKMSLAIDHTTEYQEREAEAVLELIETKNEISRKDVESLLSCSKLAAINILNRLLSQGKIVRKGLAKSVRYQLAN